MFKKKEVKQNKTEKKKRVPMVKVGTHKKTVFILWLVLLGSVSFGVYKNFTAIDMHTVHEKETIEQRIIDTNKVETFVIDFASNYYTWTNSQESIDNRNSAISKYLTKELQDINLDTIRIDIPTTSTVENVKIWEVTQAESDTFVVLYEVDQHIKEGDNAQRVVSSYTVTVHVDADGNMVITRNPTLASIPEKSSYEPKMKESDGTVDAATMNEVSEFLETFFKLYPTATEKELSYYVKGSTLEPIGGDYIFSELQNPVYTMSGKQVKVSLTVKYLDNQTKAIQLSQFDLTLEKDGNWLIVE